MSKVNKPNKDIKTKRIKPCEECSKNKQRTRLRDIKRDKNKV